MNDIRVILIGGSSHAGKSTVAMYLAERPGWMHVSTDRLARHPGRPWGEVGERPHVAKYYLDYSDDERLRSVLVHYRNMFPLIERLVRKHAENASEQRLVLEGSGLLPENVVRLRIPGVSAVWLAGTAEILRTRIHRESAYDRQADRARKMIDAFVERAIRFDNQMRSDVAKFDLPIVEVSEATTIDAFADQCLQQMRRLA